MKHEESRLISDYRDGHAPASRTNCLTIDEMLVLAGIEQGVLEWDRRDHLLTCTACADELRVILRAQPDVPLPSRRRLFVDLALVAASLVLFGVAALLFFSQASVPSVDESVVRGDLQAMVAHQPRTGSALNAFPGMFEWQSVSAERVQYRVRVHDADLQLVCDSGPLDQTNWRVPGDLAGAQGGRFTWTVTYETLSGEGSWGPFAFEITP